ncbi:peptidase T. Metallo peptidase. MEROPS family M20B [Ferrimonas sediminum]|uniref:Peptidase T n=1 Tax=Ferrimonas sediminum TaxID=718193 RepID=A0A1G8NL80_9GAMM|nr:peptidase T [Ferrimonas sediminum]SDI81051.1 peptidase T. Metallo peptidase. MEROPS family M20B [Ferrimonas sediminum]
MEKLLDRFLHYVTFDTQSDAASESLPSTEGQWVLARALHDELLTLGLSDVSLDEHGYVMATLPANVDTPVPCIGFVAHMDTAPDASGKDVKPQIIRDYDGGIIALGEQGDRLDPAQYPVLSTLKGKTLITTDGSTLLGADNKAGIAEIITAMMVLKANPQIPHGDIRIGFTPDEEIGRGASEFDVAKFGAQWAYTIDGGPVGELEYENFNAASATLRFTGNSVHPGTAKGKLVNALTLATRFHQQMPISETPEHTEGYQGFYHLVAINGGTAEASLSYIVRDFCLTSLDLRKAYLEAQAQAFTDQGMPCELEWQDGYRNMKEQVLPHPHIIELAEDAMRNCGIEPDIKPIRGGTDGAVLSYKGLPCPNVFTGGFNFHGKHEFITLEGMEQAVEVIVKLCQLTAQR